MSETQKYDEYQQAKNDLFNAVKTMKRVGGELDFTDDDIASDMNDMFTEANFKATVNIDD